MARQLNGLVMHGQPLNIQRPRAYVEPQSIKTPAAAAAIGLESVSETAVGASSVLQLSNMVTDEELADSAAVEEIKEDVIEECQKFGAVRRVEITAAERPASAATGTGDSVTRCGLVFVQFSAVEEAVNARAALSGRTFGNAAVVAQFYPEADFEAQKPASI